MRRKIFVGVLLLALGADAPASAQHGSVEDQPDLRSEFAGCAMCHETHTAARTAYALRVTPLPLAMTDLPRRAVEPDPVSRACLRCHLTPEVRGQQPELRSGITPRPGRGGFLGPDLKDDHPIGRVEADDLAGALPDPEQGLGSPPPVFRSMRSRGLVREEHLSCSTCHDPHARDDDAASPEGLSATCSACHASGRYAMGAHLSLVCVDCHRIHGGGRPLLAETVADALCTACHDPSGIPLGRYSVRPGLPHAPAGHDGTRSTGCLTCHGAHE